MNQPCGREGCEGHIVDDYCDACGRRRQDRSTRRPTGPGLDPDSPGHGRSRVGHGVVYVPPQPEVDPESIVQKDMHVSVGNRRCSRCNKLVGQPSGGAGDLERGVCGRDGSAFDFAPKLHVGTVVEKQYKVAGALGYGGQGWVYLAHDLRVRQWCVLKGRRDTADQAAHDDAMNELRSLASLHHPGIVKVFNTVWHPDPDHDPVPDPDDDTCERCREEADAPARADDRTEPGEPAGDHQARHRYLVMDFVDGRSLQQICDSPGHRGRLPVTHALAYLLAAMPALAHLHDHKFVYCDLKPENLMHHGDAVTLIDLGAAWTAEHPGRYFSTEGFDAPELDLTGPAIATDIYAAGRTLAALILGDQPELRTASGPPIRPTRGPLARHDCLWRLLDRACAPKPAQRFADADDMAEALAGVLHQVAAAELSRPQQPQPRPYPSERWQPPVARLDLFDWRSLPVPVLPAQAGRRDQLSGSTDADPAATVRLGDDPGELSWADRATVVRAHCHLGSFVTARRHIESIGREVEAPGAPRNHLSVVVGTACTYLLGVVKLAEGKPSEATELLTAAYAAAPGEPACALAVAAALEATVDDESGEETSDQHNLTAGGGPARPNGQDRWSNAEALYRQVATTDPTWVGAIAGRARILRRLGHTAQAARVLTTVPAAHPLRLDAVTTACRWLAEDAFWRPDGAAVPHVNGRRDDATVREVVDIASSLVEGSAAGPAEGPRARASGGSATTAELAAALYTLALAARESGIDLGHQVGGVAVERHALAGARAQALRRQADGTSEPNARQSLLDDAARSRPWGMVR